MKKRRMLTVMLAMSLLLATLVGCGSSQQDVRGTVSQSTTRVTETTAAPDSSKSPTPTQEAETTADSDFDVGSIGGNRWENSFIGIGCHLGESWTFLSDREIREQNEITGNIAGEDYRKAMESADLFYDMVANHSNGTDVINVILEKLPTTALLIGEKDYLSLSTEDVKDTLESIGLENIQTEMEEISFAGEKHYALRLEAEYSGVKCYETMVAIKCKGHVACITVCTWLQDDTQALLDCFYSL